MRGLGVWGFAPVCGTVPGTSNGSSDMTDAVDLESRIKSANAGFIFINQRVRPFRESIEFLPSLTLKIRLS